MTPEKLRDVYLTGEDATTLALARRLSRGTDSEFDYGTNEFPVIYEEGMTVGEEVEARSPKFRARARVKRIVAYVELV